MHFETSPSSSPSKSIPISINAMASPSSSLYSHYSHCQSVSSSRGLTSTCAYPSWPTGSSLNDYRSRSTPSSFISDADLFGDDCDDDFSTPFLQEAPAPPRQPPMAQAFPILPPIYAAEKKQKQQSQPSQSSQSSQQHRRRSSARKQRRSSKPMSPIAESVEVTE